MSPGRRRRLARSGLLLFLVLLLAGGGLWATGRLAGLAGAGDGPDAAAAGRQGSAA